MFGYLAGQKSWLSGAQKIVEPTAFGVPGYLAGPKTVKINGAWCCVRSAGGFFRYLPIFSRHQNWPRFFSDFSPSFFRSPKPVRFFRFPGFFRFFCFIPVFSDFPPVSSGRQNRSGFSVVVVFRFFFRFSVSFRFSRFFQFFRSPKPVRFFCFILFFFRFPSGRPSGRLNRSGFSVFPFFSGFSRFFCFIPVFPIFQFSGHQNRPGFSFFPGFSGFSRFFCFTPVFFSDFFSFFRSPKPDRSVSFRFFPVAVPPFFTIFLPPTYDRRAVFPDFFPPVFPFYGFPRPLIVRSGPKNQRNFGRRKNGGDHRAIARSIQGACDFFC